jgi:hypothetical protein
MSDIGFEPTVGLQAQEYRLRHKRASFLVSRRLGKAPSIYILDRVPRSCASAFFRGPLRFASLTPEKIWHNIFSGYQMSLSMFEKQVSKSRPCSPFRNDLHGTVRQRCLARNTYGC